MTTIALAESPPREIELDDYDMPGSYSRTIHDEIWMRRLNLLVVGGTSSGKTTWMRAFLRPIERVMRIVSIEDTSELRLDPESCVALHATPLVSQLRLVKIAMRLRPDRLVIGEIRDEAARAMIQSFGTGHPGCCTVHGGTLKQGLVRVQQLSGMEVGMIADVIHYAILMERDPITGKRAPTDFARVSHADNHFVLTSIERT